jgi:hypothetical protein
MQPVSTEILQLIDNAVKTALDKFGQEYMQRIESKFSAIEKRSEAVELKSTNISDCLATLEFQMNKFRDEITSAASVAKNREATLSLLAKENLTKVRQDCQVRVNELEQYNRLFNVRINGLSLNASTPGSGGCTAEVVDFFRNKLKLDLAESDIVAAHPLPSRSKQPSSTNHDGGSATTPSIIVRFTRKSTRERVLRQRKVLKGTGIGISDDLTQPSMQLLNRLKNDDRVGSV